MSGHVLISSSSPLYFPLPPSQVKLQDLGRDSGVIAHFVAHMGPNAHIAALAFNPRYSVGATWIPAS